jgi:hypothetical protein
MPSRMTNLFIWIGFVLATIVALYESDEPEKQSRQAVYRYSSGGFIIPVFT